ncbi:MAG: hypothetical protein ABJN25_18405 [Ekhidna sp.]
MFWTKLHNNLNLRLISRKKTKKMAVTRLERKGRKNKNVAKNRVNTMKRLNAVPSIKQVDIEEIKAEFANKAKSKKEEPKAEKAAPKKEIAPKKEAAPKAEVADAPKKEVKKAAPKKKAEPKAKVAEKKEAKPKAEKKETKKAAPKKPAAKKKEDK